MNPAGDTLSRVVDEQDRGSRRHVEHIGFCPDDLVRRRFGREL